MYNYQKKDENEGLIMLNNVGTYISFGLYFIFMLGIGVYYYTKSKTMSDYILGGRTLNSWVAALSAQASDMSGWLLLGLPGAAYVSGLEAGWIGMGLLVGTYLNWKFIAKRLRRYTEIAGDAITISDYLENRFRDKSKTLKVMSATFILFFFLIYTASGFVAGATLFTNIFDISYTTALIIGALVVISYTFLGGFLAVCWTDFFQGILMFIAIIIVPLSCIVLLGGVEATYSKIMASDPNLLNLFVNGAGEKVTSIGVISLVAWGLGYFGQPHIHVRFMGIKDPEEIKKSRLIAMVWVTISLFFAVVVGIVGKVYLQESLENSETIFMTLLSLVFHPVIAGILLAAILAAIMSTADSQLLVTASAISEDFYKSLIRKNATDKELVWVSRGTVIGVALIAFVLALNPKSSVMGLVSYAWAGFGATFGPVMLFSLYWKRMNKWGAMAGMLVGGVTTILWKLTGSELYEIIPGFILSMIAIIVVTLVTQAPDKDIVEEFNRV